MKHTPNHTVSMASRFRQDYLIVSIIPLLFLFILVVLTATITRNHLSRLMVRATYDLNKDAELSLQKLGERMIQTKARDVAKQVEIYIEMHPNTDITEMRKDPHFLDLALQKVGTTGYTAIYEAGTWIFRVHPNEKLIDQDVSYLAKKIPSWWALVSATRSGHEVSGYYNWVEPDGTIRKKFMTITPTHSRINGKIMMVAATTYIDEFSAPIVEMKTRADAIVGEYQNYVSQQWLTFSIIAAVLIILTFCGTYFLGRRAGLRYIAPIAQLAEGVREFGEGKRDITGIEALIHRKDEIGALAQAFNRMSQQLAEVLQRLEQRLAQLDQTQAALKESESHYKTLYEESRRGEELYRSLIHSSADAIVIYDLEGNTRYISPMFTKIFGWSEEEMVGRRIPFVPESEEASTRETIDSIIQRGTQIHGFETRRLTREGQLIDVSISASRYDDHQGKPAGMLVTLRDITEKKRLEAQFQRIERMEAIGTLAGGIAHDFNNLLMVIQGSAAMLMRAMDPADPNYKNLLYIDKQVQRGAKLTSQLLGYARKGKYEVRAVNLNEVVIENTEAFRRTRKDISIHFGLAPDLRPIEVDIHQIEQVLMNLFINASDAMPEGGDLFIRTSNTNADHLSNDGRTAPQQGEYVMMSVADTGTGMSLKIKERIFDPFFTTKEMGRGTGLGLASVYGIIKGHGGHIDVESVEGKGSTFTIYLPASSKAVEMSAPAMGKISKGKGTILLIDDEEIVLDVGASMLKTLGYTVLKAGSGRQALEIFRSQADGIDMVILDMIMPDMSGGILFDYIREIDPKAAIVLSSGYSLDGKAMEILNRGCRGFIQKPYTMEQLSEKIQSILTKNENRTNNQ